jgi:hypothetical protein
MKQCTEGYYPNETVHMPSTWNEPDVLAKYSEQGRSSERERGEENNVS